MESNRTSRCLILGLAGLLLASLVQAAPAEIVLPDGKPLHKTENLVSGERVLPLKGQLRLHRWEEELPSGEVRSFYAYSRTDQDGSSVVGRVRETTHLIRLLDFQFDPLADTADLAGFLKTGAPTRLHLVQLEATPLPEMRKEIEATGARILRFLADHTFLVKSEPAPLARVRSLSYVRAIVPYQAIFRVEPVLRDALQGNAGTLATQRYSLMVGERRSDQEVLADKIRRAGGTVELVEPGGWRVEATLNHRQLAEIVEEDEVQFVDRWGGPGELDMNIVRETGGGNYVESVAGYTGQGVRGEIFDTELLTTHQEWQYTPIVHSVSTSCSSLHGTSCYSNNFAQGVDPDARGMLPDGQGIFFCYSESTQFGGTKSRYDINAELIDPAGPYRAVFQTSSVGSARTFFYTTLSAETDDYLFLHQILSTQSQSNAGNQDSRPQAWAKNIVSVGGIRHLNTLDRCDDYHGAGGSTGPAEDGRIKPDLSFFYDSIHSASGSSNASYTEFGGTSSATPQTSGHFGLLFQMWHDGVWAGFGGAADVFDSRPQMATAKALMINNAWRYDWVNATPCSYGDADRFRQGWGTSDLQRLYDRAPVTSVIDETDVITPLGSKSYTATVAPGETELNVTMVYVDPAGTVGAQVNRVNDLSLRVTSPSATVYWGNNGLTADNWSTSGGVSNTIDTVENVFIQNPEAGSWTIEVFGDEIVEDAHLETGEIDADFALVVSGGAIGPTTCSVDADCDNGRYCDGVEVCVGGFCQPGTPVTCDDGVSCTVDTCNEGTDSCDFTPDDAACDNGAFCDGAEVCSATLGCQAGTPPVCTHGCDPVGNSCFECSVGADCDDSLYCNGVEVCNAGYCGAGSDPCPGQCCDEATTSCGVSNDPQNAVFDAGLGVPACACGSSCDSQVLLDGRANLGPEPNQPNTLDGCADGISGTYHSDESNDRIVITNLSGTGFQEGDTVEVAATVWAWSTGSSDTADFYYAADANAPVWTYIGSVVPPSGGVHTLTQQYVLPAGSLQAVRVNFRYSGSVGSCTGGSYDDRDDLVFSVAGAGPGCTVNADCDDGLFCNGAETCNAGTCQAGTAPNCDDGVSCTDDSCNEGTASCDNVANDANCDNGLFCDGSETCDPVLDCQAGTAPSCDDGVGCTDDSCNEGTASCDNVANDANCDNGLFCDGAETCDPALDCQPGPGDPCQAGETCDETNDTCVGDCVPKGGSCNVDADCCDLQCRGKAGAKTCK